MQPLAIERIPAGIYAANCYIVFDETTKDALIIDPAGDAHKISKFITQKELSVKAIFITHGHGDHIGAVEELRDLYKVEVYVHQADEYMLQSARHNLSNLMSGPDVAFDPDWHVGHGERMTFGSLNIEIIHTPGHTKGGICILHGNQLFTGDTLFAGSIGRTDLEGGNHNELLKSIHDRLLNMNDGVEVYPGHGSASTIGRERKSNPFFR